MISLQNLHKSYGSLPVLQGFTCEARAGEVTLLIGNNGAGKSTALKIATGALNADAGVAMIAGANTRIDRRRAQSLTSSLPQNVDFHPRLSVHQLLRFYAAARGVDRDRVDREARRWGLEEHARKRAGQLSGGLRQRLGLAVLMLPDTPALILDEPGISLDPDWRERMQDVLATEAQQGRAVLIATHLLGEWEARADRCLLCNNGRIIREVDPSDLRPGLSAIPNLAAV